MGDVPGLIQDPKTGQRLAWSGYDWVPVPRDFDPRESAFRGGVTREVNRFGAGLKQLVAAMRGDDAALFALATEQEKEDWAQRVRSRDNPVTGFLGSAAPYVVAGAGVGGAAARAGASAGQAAAAGVLTDATIAALSYGSPAERATGAVLAVTGGAVGAVVARAFGMAQASRANARAARAGLTPEVEAVPAGGAPATGPALAGGVELPGPMAGGARGPALAGGVELPGPMAGGASVGDEFTQSYAGRVLERLAQTVRPEETAARLRQTARLRDLARKHKIMLHPSAAMGSRGMADFESGLQSDPFSAGPWIRRQQGYHREVEARVKEAFGLKGWQGPVDREFAAAAADVVSDGYAELAQKSAPVAVADILEGARKNAVNEKVGWTKGIEDTFNRQLELIRQEGDSVTGEAAWTLQRQFARVAAEARDSREAQMFYSISDAIETQIIQAAGSEVDPAVLQLMRKRYRALKRLNVRRSFSDTDGFRYRSALGALSDEFDEFRRGHGFEPGAYENSLMAPMNDLFEVLRVGQLFGQSRGDSGTATRLAFQQMSSNPLSMGIRKATAEAYYAGYTAAGAY